MFCCSFSSGNPATLEAGERASRCNPPPDTPPQRAGALVAISRDVQAAGSLSWSIFADRVIVLAAAQAVVNAPTSQVRRASLGALRDAAPWLARRLARGLVRVPYPSQASPRTNNVCERGFREWRRRTRPMDGFGSWQGARNFATLWM